MEHLLQDIAYAVRALRHQRGFALAALAALALGIGATTAVFSVVNAVLLKPLPYPAPDRIVMFMNRRPTGSTPSASPAKFMFWTAQTNVIEDAAAFRNVTVNFTGSDAPEQLTSGNVSANFFPLLGARVILGRTFATDEDLPNGPKAAILSYGWWIRRFGANPSVLGKIIQLSGESYTVIGVLEKDFDPTELVTRSDVWTAFQLDPNTADQGNYFSAAARLRPGVSLAQAMAHLAQSTDRYREQYPTAIRQQVVFSVEPLSAVVVHDARSQLVILLATVMAVLLIACANVANLLLVRATVRRREMAIRSAMGADRQRITRQLMTESVVLSAIGGILGVGVGLAGIRWLLSINTAGLPRVGDNGGAVQIDGRVLLFAGVVSLLTGLLFGLVPAVHAARENLSLTLRESSGLPGAGRTGAIRSGLVVFEIALAVALVVGAGLLIRTSLALRAVKPGFDATNVLTMSTSFTGPRFATTASIDQVLENGIQRLKTVPGVEAASASCCVPLEPGFDLEFRIVGRPVAEGLFHGVAGYTSLSPNYFEVFRIPVLRGRSFTEHDKAGSPPVVIINESMANQYFKGADPIGQQLTIARGRMREFATEPDRQIIGVVADSKDNGLNQTPGARMFVPQSQTPDAVTVLNSPILPITWMVRTRVPANQVTEAIRAQIRAASGLPVANPRSMNDVLAQSTSRERFNSFLMTTFACLALALAAIGVYGVMAYSVQQRKREIGVRLALGASPRRIQTMVVLQGMRLAVAGMLTGIAAALLLTRYLQGLLFGVDARDPFIFAGVPLLLGFVAFLAVWIPAMRASRIDPLGALRAS
jgi:putative ABC transport system permease protein